MANLLLMAMIVLLLRTTLSPFFFSLSLLAHLFAQYVYFLHVTPEAIPLLPLSKARGELCPVQ